jgi:VWFA-related protein
MKTLPSNPRASHKGMQYLLFRLPRNLFVFLAAAVLFGCFSFLHAWPLQSQQSSAQSTQEQAPADGRRLSTIFITARFKDGTRAEFSAGDIEIRADGKPVTVSQTRELVGVPLYYCLLFDASVSQPDRFKLQQDEATELLSKVVKAGSDHGILVDINDNYYLDRQGTDPQKFVDFIATERPHGGTALYDAAFASAKHLSENSPVSSPRVLFILSHREDNESVTQDRVVQFALKTGIRVYAIGQLTPRDPAYFRTAKGFKILRQLAEATGGEAYFPERRDVGKVVADIADDLTNLYAVTFELPSQKKDNQRHKLEIKCTKKNVSIKAQNSYFAPEP